MDKFKNNLIDCSINIESLRTGIVKFGDDYFSFDIKN